MSLKDLLAASRQRVEAALERWLPSADSPPQRLHAALRYAALDGGKRVRPLLVYATGQAFGAAPALLDAPACAVELIHAYSLVHDDLPAMDNDDLRRGKPTCHRAFDEATAILAGDALQALAFEILARDTLQHNATQQLRMVAELAKAAGSLGMCGGQAIDIEAAGEMLSLSELAEMHAMKTGALIRASVRLGALSAPEISQSALLQLDDYAAALGLAFQIRDDILDVEADTTTLGKPQGSDQARSKPTYTSLLGVDGAKQKLHEAHLRCLTSLNTFGAEADPLRWIADYVVTRGH